jgi:hypothetical protein
LSEDEVLPVCRSHEINAIVDRRSIGIGSSDG